MQHPPHPARAFAHHRGDVALGLARVHNQRKVQFLGQLDVPLERHPLRGSRRVFVVVVQPGLADRNAARVPCRLAHNRHLVPGGPGIHLVGMHPRGGPDRVMAPGQIKGAQAVVAVRRNGDHPLSRRFARPLQHIGQILLEGLVGEMAVRVEESQTAAAAPDFRAFSRESAVPKRFWISRSAGEAMKIEE